MFALRPAFFALVLTVTQSAFAFQLRDLSWMEGAWKSTSAAGVYENSFSSTNGGLVIGTAKLTALDGTLSFYEYDEIKEVNGTLQLTPIPFGQRGVTFTATSVGIKSVVFENASHDFPRSIAYSINADGHLTLVVEGVQGGQPVRMEFELKKN